MQHGHYTGPRRATWDIGGCTEHVTEPRRAWWEAGKERTPDVTLPFDARPGRQRVNQSTGWYAVYATTDGRFVTKFQHNGVMHLVGYFRNVLEAARAHDTYCQRNGIERKLNRDLRPEAFTDSHPLKTGG